jgi:hypothetical protein
VVRRVLKVAVLGLAALAFGGGCGDDDAGDDYDPCEGKGCGEPCTLCAPDDRDCVEPERVLKYCNAQGQCRAEVAVCE